MGIMLRVAGVPSRVVLGYTHEVPDESGTFTITTNNAHSWVEAYFDGIGWVPFDPTPLDGHRRRQEERSAVRAAPRAPPASRCPAVTARGSRPRGTDVVRAVARVPHRRVLVG